MLTTLHTNDACSAITRMINMGVEPYLIGAALNMVLAQRLVRRICPKCKSAYEPPRTVRKAIEKMGFAIDEFHRGVGCKNCRNTGYSGRIGVHELLILDDDIRDIVVNNPTVASVQAAALAKGMITLRQDGFRKVREGITTIEEILHITGDIRDTGETHAPPATSTQAPQTTA